MNNTPSRRPLSLALAALALSHLAGCYEVVGPDAPAADASTVRCPVTPAAPLAIASVRDLGPLAQPSRVTAGLGATVATHAGPRWIFAEVGLRPLAADPRHRLNAAIAAPASDDPSRLDEPLDRFGAPSEAAPYRAAERAGSVDEPGGLLALWPSGAAVPVGDRTALFVTRWRVRPGFLSLTPDGVEAAWWPGDGRALERGALLYRGDERAYLPAAVDGDDVYLQQCNVVGVRDAECRVARTTRSHLFDRASLRYWDGAAWSPDPARAAVVVRGMNGFTLAWNRHLARWVAVYAEVLGDGVFARSAPRPEGPWSDAVRVMEVPRPPRDNVYGATLHAALSDPEGCSFVAGWYAPTADASGENRLVEVTLR